MIVQVPVDLIALLLAGTSAYWLRFTPWALSLRPVVFQLTFHDFFSLVFWVALSWIVMFAIAGLYSANPNRRFASDIVRIFLASSLGLAAIAVYVMFTQQLFDSRFLVVAAWGFAIVYVIFGRLLLRGLKALLYRKGMGLRRVVIIGSDVVADRITKALESRKELGYAVVGVFKTFSKETEAASALLNIDELFFTNPRAHENEAVAAIEFCNQHHNVFKYSADLFATIASNMSVHPLAGIPIVELQRTPLDGWGRVVKRGFDVVVSIIALILLSPLFFLIACVIALETGRPIIYKNERVGLRGKPFFTFKFRSMYQEDSTGPQFGASGKKAEKKEQELIKKKSARIGPIYKIPDDPRVTPFGRFLRRSSMDELPQFLNVVKGEMSVVGPRPHQPREVRQYERTYKQVFTLKPGITGLAQISGRSDLSFEEEMKLDIFYIEKWTVLLDMIICLKTPFILLKKRKAL